MSESNNPSGRSNSLQRMLDLEKQYMVRTCRTFRVYRVSVLVQILLFLFSRSFDSTPVQVSSRTRASVWPMF